MAHSLTHASKTGRINTLASIAVIVAGLYFARDVLIPLALAIMLSFLLAPLLLRLQRWGLPRIAALIVVIVLVIGAVGGLGFVVYAQLTDLAGKLDQYKQNIQEKVDWVRGVTNNGAIDQAMKVFKETTERASTQPTTVPNSAAPNPTTRPVNPVPVFVTNERPADAAGGNAFKNLYASISPMIDPIATAGIVLIF